MQRSPEAVAQQCAEWKLTPADADIAGFILKGASLRGIAVLRRSSEATIRQQAQGICRKPGLANRSALAAFFLGDLFEAAEGALDGAEGGRTCPPPN